MKKSFRFWVLIVLFVFSACGRTPPESPPLTQRAIAVQITKEYCPSIEVQPNTYVTWTNADSVDRMLLIERRDEQGVVVESGGMSLLGPGSTFSMMLTEVGQYTYYCSLDRKQFGTINVASDTLPTSTTSQILPTIVAGASECVETMIPALISEIQPAQPTAGSEITIIGNGGLLQDSCGKVNESARSFTLYLDAEPAGDLMCYVNHCESKLRLPITLTKGSHCLTTHKDVCEFQFEVVT